MVENVEQMEQIGTEYFFYPFQRNLLKNKGLLNLEQMEQMFTEKSNLYNPYIHAYTHTRIYGGENGVLSVPSVPLWLKPFKFKYLDWNR